MSDTEILEGNTMIHDWIGARRMKHPFEHWWIGAQKPEDLLYHSSWDWLIPAVKKIQQLKIEDFPKKKPVINAMHDVEKKLLWAAVVAFITWYNKQS